VLNLVPNRTEDPELLYISKMSEESISLKVASNGDTLITTSSSNKKLTKVVEAEELANVVDVKDFIWTITAYMLLNTRDASLDLTELIN